MKKVNILLAGLAFLGFVSCGSTTSDKAAAEAAEETVVEETPEVEADTMAEADTMVEADTMAVADTVAEEVAE